MNSMWQTPPLFSSHGSDQKPVHLIASTGMKQGEQINIGNYNVVPPKVAKLVNITLTVGLMVDILN